MINIQRNQHKIQVFSTVYTWELDVESYLLYLYDSENRLISRARHQPLVIGAEMPPSAATSFEIKRDRISIIYEIKASASRLTVN